MTYLGQQEGILTGDSRRYALQAHMHGAVQALEFHLPLLDNRKRKSNTHLSSYLLQSINYHKELFNQLHTILKLFKF